MTNPIQTLVGIASANIAPPNVAHLKGGEGPGSYTSTAQQAIIPAEAAAAITKLSREAKDHAPNIDKRTDPNFGSNPDDAERHYAGGNEEEDEPETLEDSAEESLNPKKLDVVA